MYKNNDFIPVTLIRGFLEAGKTTLINHLITTENLHNEQILLLSCEEGEISYDETALQRENLTLVELEEESCLNQTYLEQLTALYTPSRIIVECNVMWKMIEFEIPANWKVEKRIAVLAATTLEMYLDNMRSYFGPMLSRCDQILITQCKGGPNTLSPLKAKLRPLLDDISAVTIESEGKIYDFHSIKDLVPYDLNEDTIAISSEKYGFWFYDCQDHQDRYEGKRISLNASIKKSPVMKTGDFALGRIAMTCCEADMSFLGYIAHYDAIASFPQYAYVHAEAVITYRFIPSYQKIMPYLEVIHMEQSSPEQDVVTF